MTDKLKVVQFVKRANSESDDLTPNEVLEGSMKMLDGAMVIAKEKWRDEIPRMPAINICHRYR